MNHVAMVIAEYLYFNMTRRGNIFSINTEPSRKQKALRSVPVSSALKLVSFLNYAHPFTAASGRSFDEHRKPFYLQCYVPLPYLQWPWLCRVQGECYVSPLWPLPPAVLPIISMASAEGRRR